VKEIRKGDIPADIETCRLAIQKDCESKAFLLWMEKLKQPLQLHYHRKRWEWYYICQRLLSFDMLRKGIRGLGFGVGTEPLGALFASCGVQVTMTDIDPGPDEWEAWVKTKQHCNGDLAMLNASGICSPEDWKANATFEYADMRNIPTFALKDFNFCWSANSLDHLGSIGNGWMFVFDSLRTLVNGGLAIHTTEFNLQNGDTHDIERTSFFQQKHVVSLVNGLREAGHRVLPLDLHPGCDEYDLMICEAPYSDLIQLKIRNIWPITSIGLCIQKNGDGNG
jgi:hypothetical protein